MQKRRCPLHDRRPTTLTITLTAATSNEYDVMSDYAAALEEQVTALHASDGAQSVVSSSASTINTDIANTVLLKEIRAEHKEQVGQMKQITAMIAAMKGTSTPAEPTSRDRVHRKSKKPIRRCANCKKCCVNHKDANCMELEVNTSKRDVGWKSCL